MQHSMSRAYNGGRNRILRWTGPGKFTDVDAGLPDGVAHGWTLAIGAAALDGNVLPEVCFASDFGPDRLMYNESRPRHNKFRLVEGRRDWLTPKSKVVGEDSFKSMGVDFGDLNGDGIPDMFVSNIT